MMKTKIIETFDIGDQVICDLCNKDWTDRKESGGFVFGSKGVCPDCERHFMRSIVHYNEQEFIAATCPENTSFADFIRAFRNGDNTIKFITFKDE